MRNLSILGLLFSALLILVDPLHAEVDRDKLLKEPGVFATFAVFKLGDHWWQLDHDARVKAASEVKKGVREVCRQSRG